VDNRSQFTLKVMQLWSGEHGVELLFIQPGKPTQNALSSPSTTAFAQSSSTRNGPILSWRVNPDRETASFRGTSLP
jgi:hypothetical protein